MHPSLMSTLKKTKPFNRISPLQTKAQRPYHLAYWYSDLKPTRPFLSTYLILPRGVLLGLTYSPEPWSSVRAEASAVPWLTDRSFGGCVTGFSHDGPVKAGSCQKGVIKRFWPGADLLLLLLSRMGDRKPEATDVSGMNESSSELYLKLSHTYLFITVASHFGPSRSSHYRIHQLTRSSPLGNLELGFTLSTLEAIVGSSTVL